jgi:hypothetical protein
MWFVETRVNAACDPSGDQMGHQSIGAGRLTVDADAGTAVARSTASTMSFFTDEAYG